jgi:hypothetical protein
MEATMMKKGGRSKSMKQKQKQKQSIVIKNVINVNERKKRMNKRQRRARTQPTQAPTQLPTGGQYPLQKLFQPQQSVYRSVVMTSANANEASNNVSNVVDATQKISDGKLNALIDNKLESKPYARLLDEINNTPIKREEKDEEKKYEDIPPPALETPIPSYSSSSSSVSNPPPPKIFNPRTGRYMNNTPNNRRKLEEEFPAPFDTPE